MSLELCLEKLQKYTKESGMSKNIPDSRLKEFARQLEAAGGDALTPAQFAEKTQELINGEQERWYAKKQAANALIIAKRETALKNIFESMQSFKESVKVGEKTPMAKEAFRAWLEGGSLRPGVESNLSVEKMAHAIQGQLRSVLNEALNHVQGLKDAAAGGKMDRDVIQELDSLDRKLPLMQSGNALALEYAKAIKVFRDKIFSLKQANNPFMEQAQDYLLKQFHDRQRVSADPSEEGKQAWLSQAMQTFGEKSFPGATQEEKIQAFKNIYDRIVDGRWGSIADDSASDKYITVRGDGGNLMRRMSQGRQLIAKDWSSWYDYQSKYGPPTVYEGLNRVASSASKDLATLSKFGPNPRGMYEGLYQRVLSKLDGAEADDFKTAKKSFDRSFEVTTGIQNTPARGQLAKFVQGALGIQYLSKTGASLFRSLPDITLGASLIKDLNGHTIFSNAASLATEYAKAMGSSKYAKERLADVSLFSNAYHRELIRTLGSPESGPGTLAGLADKMGSLNLMNRHIDAIRSATGTVLSKLLGSMASSEHAELPAQIQKGLARYGIDEKAWNVIREGVDKIGSRTMLTPEGIHALPDDTIKSYLDEKNPSKSLLDYTRFQLGLKLGTMINEHADLSSAHPDIRQKSFLWGDTTINERIGMLRRLCTQFKTATVVSNDVYRRAYFSGQTLKGSFAGLSQLMIAGAFAWSLGEFADQMAQGKKPEDPTSPSFIAKASVGSGMAGIYGDLFLNQFQRQGLTDKMLAVSNAALGPTLGTGVEAIATVGQGLAELAGKARTGPAERKATNLLLGNIPLQNLFYTKAAFNYYFANQLKEFVGPGYLSYLRGQTSKTQALGGGAQDYLFAKPGSDHFLGN